VRAGEISERRGARQSKRRGRQRARGAENARGRGREMHPCRLAGKAKETSSARERRKAVKKDSIYAYVSPCVQGLIQNNILSSR